MWRSRRAPWRLWEPVIVDLRAPDPALWKDRRVLLTGHILASRALDWRCT